jgi:selenophosphate synthase
MDFGVFLEIIEKKETIKCKVFLDQILNLQMNQEVLDNFINEI